MILVKHGGFLAEQPARNDALIYKKSAALAAPIVTIPYDETQAILSYSPGYDEYSEDVKAEYYFVVVLRINAGGADFDVFELVGDVFL